MKSTKFLLLPLLAALVLLAFKPNTNGCQPRPASSHRADNGEDVLIVVVYVKDEKKAEFDRWIKDVLYAALYKTTSTMKKDQLKVTRWLSPVRQNDDKSWTYAWIMDPVIPNTDYDIPNFLNKEYGEEKGIAYWEQYLSFMAKPVEVHSLIQTNY